MAVSDERRFESMVPCERCGRFGPQVWISKDTHDCQHCRALDPAWTSWFAEQANAVAALPRSGDVGTWTALQPVLRAACEAYERDPVSARKLITLVLEFRPADVQLPSCTVVSPDLVPECAVVYTRTVDPYYVLGRGLACQDEKGVPDPIPGVRWGCC